MNPLITSINNLAGSVLAAELNSYWLAIGVAAAAWAALKFAPRVNAATRHAIGWAVLAVVLVLPFAPHVSLRTSSQPAGVPVQAAAPAAPQLIVIEEPAAVMVPAQRVGFWPLAGFALWAALLVFRLAQIAQSWMFLTGVKRRASILARPLALRRRTQLLLSTEIESPIAVGFLKPAIILPASLPEQLSEPELDHVLLHEAAHIARFDDWTNLAARIAGAALALHPAALWILRQIERQREAACDDFVVVRTGQAHPYAKSLAKLFELHWARRADLLAAGIFGRGSRLGDRIEALLRAGRKFSARASVAALAGSTAVLLALAAAGSLAPRWVAFAQQRLEFEVATVKPAGPPEAGRFLVGIGGGPGTNDPGRITYTNLPLKTIITNAYNVKPYQVAGPSWLDSERFNVTAKVPEGATRDQARLMMQSLLADRFKMTLHHETKELPIYEMTVARGGIKIKEEAEDPNAPKGPPPGFGPGGGGPPPPPAMDKNGFPQLPAGRRGMVINMAPGRMRMTSSVQSITDLANMLGNQLGMPVVDKTGLTGTYTYTLEFAPEPGQNGPLGLPPLPPPPGAEPGGVAGRGGPVADTPSDVPNVFTALQEQLGLKLDRKRGPVDTLVIDSIEKTPTEN